MSLTTTIDTLHAAIIADLTRAFGEQCAQIGAYAPWDDLTGTEPEELVAPALLLELESFDVDESPDPADRCPVLCTLAIHCVLSQQTERLPQALAQWAATVARRVRFPEQPDRRKGGNTWGLAPAVETPTRVNGQPGEFRPGLNGRDGWIVRWEQVVYLPGWTEP